MAPEEAMPNFVGAIVIEIVGRAENGCQPEVNHGDEHAFLARSDADRGVFAVDVLDVIHVVGVIARNQVAHGLFAIWSDIARMQRVGAGGLERRVILFLDVVRVVSLKVTTMSPTGNSPVTTGCRAGLYTGIGAGFGRSGLGSPCASNGIPTHTQTT